MQQNKFKTRGKKRIFVKQNEKDCVIIKDSKSFREQKKRKLTADDYDKMFYNEKNLAMLKESIRRLESGLCSIRELVCA